MNERTGFFLKADKVNHYIYGLCFLFTVVVYFLFYSIRYNVVDTPNFVGATLKIYGLDGIDNQFRFTKPIPLLLPGFFYVYFGISIPLVMLVQNAVFYFFSGILLKKILAMMQFSALHQVLGVLIFYSLQAIAVHVFENINDVCGYFFMFLIIVMYKKWYYQRSYAGFLILIFLSTMGILSKESAAAGVLFVFIDLLLSQERINKKLIFSGLYITGVLFTLFICNSIIFNIVGVNDTLFSNVVSKWMIVMNEEGYKLRILQIVRGFDVIWLLYVFGLIRVVLNERRFINIYTLGSVLILLGTLLWPSVQDRTITVGAVIVIPVVLKGLNYFSKNNQLILVLTAVLGNLGISHVIYSYGVSGLLAPYYLAYGMLFSIFLINEFKKRRVGIQGGTFQIIDTSNTQKPTQGSGDL